MKNKFSIPGILLFLLLSVSCSQETPKALSGPSDEEQQGDTSNKKEPHRYGGWYCPDNFGFVPVDIGKLDQVPAISDRLPTKEELHDHQSLIEVDIAKYPDARALEMELPRVARIYSERRKMSELIIVIQAIIVSGDTVVGYRFANGGNGSAWINDVTFLSDEEVADMGSQPFFFRKSVVNASKEEIWDALSKTDYFVMLGLKFNQQGFFGSEMTWGAEAFLERDSPEERATGYAGVVYGNFYLHIDYVRDGFHYSEKLLMIENTEDNTTELFFASGPYPDDFENNRESWDSWFETVKEASEEK